MLKVATYNIKNKTASKLLRLKPSAEEMFKMNAELIRESNPDIIGLQEVTKEEYEKLINIFGNEYQMYGKFRNSLGFTNEACPLMVKKDIGLITSHKTYSISKTPENLGKRLFGSFMKRSATVIHFDDGFDQYCIVNSHIDNSFLTKVKSYDILSDIITKEMENYENLIITGDFNSDMNGALKDFCYSNFLSDATEDMVATYKPLNKSIGHIFIDTDIEYYNTQFNSNRGSDHSLIMTEIHSKRS